MGKAKYESLGRPYPWDGQDRLDDDQMSAFAGLFKSHGFHACIGG
jgi:hypothetical protein